MPLTPARREAGGGHEEFEVPGWGGRGHRAAHCAKLLVGGTCRGPRRARGGCRAHSPSTGHPQLCWQPSFPACTHSPPLPPACTAEVAPHPNECASRLTSGVEQGVVLTPRAAPAAGARPARLALAGRRRSSRGRLAGQSASQRLAAAAGTHEGRARSVCAGGRGRGRSYGPAKFSA